METGLEFPILVRSTLNRRQGFELLRKTVGILPWIPGVLLFTFFCIRTALAIWHWEVLDILVFGALTLFALFCLSPAMGYIGLLIYPQQSSEFIFEEDAIGIRGRTDTQFLFLDGITQLKQFTSETWTLRHFNGLQITFAASALNPRLIEHMRAAMVRGKTPEGIQAVIERGRRIQAMERER
ncbi:MAG: hypothetical protein AB7O26_16895 [Planctomycetaceae bacterium]